MRPHCLVGAATQFVSCETSLLYLTVSMGSRLFQTRVPSFLSISWFSSFADDSF